VSKTLDCKLTRDLFGSEVPEIFDSRALFQPWLGGEVALAEAEAEVEARRETPERGLSSRPCFERGELTEEAQGRLLDPLAYLGESCRVVDETIRAGGGNGNS
jgi:hypothetical protein